MKANQHAGVIVLALAVFGSGAYAYQLNREGNRNDCQAKINLAVSQNIRIRSEIAQLDNAAKTNLLDGVSSLLLLPPTKNPKVEAKRAENFLELFRDFKKTMSAVAVARAQNPVPEIDPDAC